MLLAAFLLVLLAVLAVLQYRWLGRATEADRQRTSTSLQSAAERFGADFNRELADLLALLLPGLLHGADQDGVSAAVARWQERAAWPGLVRGIWRVDLGEAGILEGAVESGEEDDAADLEMPVALKSLQGTEDPAPVELRHLALRLAQHRQEDGPGRSPLFGHPRVLMAEVPALVLPERSVVRGRRGDGRRSQRPRHRRAGPRESHESHESHDRAPDYWLIHLDREVIRTQVLPDLVDRHFSAESSLGLRVVDLEGEEIWRSAIGPDAAEALASTSPVASSELFGPLRPRDGFFGGRRPPGPFAPVHDVLAAAAGIHRGQWRLEVLHPAGSLDAAVSHAMHRSMALSLLILLVLAVSVVLLTRGARRARALARRQLEFVAGVTHELKTPLAALRSAGQNLADGVVKPERVKTYGQLVDREGRRLEDTVGQILAYAGLESGRELRTRALDPHQAARDAIEDLRPWLDERRVDVELTVADGVPNVSAEPDSLGRALRNLLHNAALHGQSQEDGADAGRGWIGLAVDAADGVVRFRVSDRGPGIDPADHRRIFEPFVRGHGLAASNVPGSGLGLALVRQVADAHGGSVRVEADGGITTFVLALPAGSPDMTQAAIP